MSTIQNNAGQHFGAMIADTLDAWEGATPEARKEALAILRRDAAPKAQHPVRLDDIQSDVWHAYELLDTIVDTIMEMEFVRDGKRDHQMDRVSALTWIARDHLQQIGRMIDENFATIARGAQT